MMPLAASVLTVFMFVPPLDEQLLGTVANPPVVSPMTCSGIDATVSPPIVKSPRRTDPNT